MSHSNILFDIIEFNQFGLPYESRTTTLNQIETISMFVIKLMSIKLLRHKQIMKTSENNIHNQLTISYKEYM